MRTEPQWYHPWTIEEELGITGSAEYYRAITSSVLPTTDEYVEFLPSKLYTWQCSYCGTNHWIEDRQLQCSKCGGPRDV